MRHSAEQLRLERENPTELEHLPFESVINDDVVTDSLNLLQRNLIGKNTFELNTYASHTCWDMALEDSITGFSISELALSRGDCRTGKSKILLEKLLYRKNNKAICEIKDELLIESHDLDTYYTTLHVALTEKDSKHHYLVSYRDKREEIITTIHKLWLIDLIHGKLTPVNVPAQFKFNNPDYLE